MHGNVDAAFGETIDAAGSALLETYPEEPRHSRVHYFLSYSHAHSKRFERMQELIVAESGKLLDIGFNPILTHLYMRDGRADVSLASHGDVPAGGQPAHDTWIIRGQPLPTRYFDIERHVAPYGDGEFDLVVFLEVLEHLSTDPMRALAEINRITKLGGALLLSTPNITSYRALRLLIQGRSPYISSKFLRTPSTNRHNREYTPDELKDLVTCAGYRVDHIEAPFFVASQDSLESVRSLVQSAPESLRPGITTEGLRGDTVVLRCTKVSDVVERYPAFLYF